MPGTDDIAEYVLFRSPPPPNAAAAAACVELTLYRSLPMPDSDEGCKRRRSDVRNRPQLLLLIG